MKISPNKRYFLPLAVIAAGLAVALLFVATPNTAKKKTGSADDGLLVEVQQAATGDFTATVEAMGQVVASKQVQLRPRVSGEIVRVDPHYIPGGYFKAGAPMLYIDKTDYELALASQRAAYQQAQADMQLEMGRQDIARDEMEILSKTVGREIDNAELALRGPQLEQAKADVQIAKSNLDQARLNLERTTIKAPFNALVTERAATLGDTVSPQDVLATLVSTDEYWVELSVPVPELAWLSSKADGDAASKAVIYIENGRVERSGYLLRVVGTLDPQSRLADVIVAVPDPLLLKAKKKDGAPLIVGDYVRVSLEGKSLDDTLRVPLGWVRDGQRMWVLVDGALEIREVEIAYEDREYAYVASGISAQDKIVTSDILAPVDGMKLRMEEEEEAQDEPGEDAS